MNGAYSPQEVYTESDVQYIVQYAGAVRFSIYHGLLCSYGHAVERHRCSSSQYLLFDFAKANFMIY